MVRIWEFQMSQIHFSLIFLKGENRRQKRKEHLLGAEVGNIFREGSETKYFRLFFLLGQMVCVLSVPL